VTLASREQRLTIDRLVEVDRLVESRTGVGPYPAALRQRVPQGEQIGAVAAILLNDELGGVVAGLAARIERLLGDLEDPIGFVAIGHLQLAREEVSQLVQPHRALLPQPATQGASDSSAQASVGAMQPRSPQTST